MRSSLILALTVLTLMPLRAADGKLSPESADSFTRKVVLIVAQAAAPDAAGERRTRLSETELNSWFAYRAAPLLRSGITEPSLTIVGGGRVSGRAIVDLEAVARTKRTGRTLDPWGLIGGRVPVTVTGTLRARDGVGQFQLESGHVSGIPIPKVLLQEMVSYYSRTDDRPDGLSLDDEFALPVGIRSIEVAPGQATIVQ